MSVDDRVALALAEGRLALLDLRDGKLNAEEERTRTELRAQLAKLREAVGDQIELPYRADTDK